MIRCPNCKKQIPFSLFARELGKRTSPRKAASSKENGKLGGRPPKQRGKQSRKKSKH